MYLRVAPVKSALRAACMTLTEYVCPAADISGVYTALMASISALYAMYATLDDPPLGIPVPELVVVRLPKAGDPFGLTGRNGHREL
jgi:hypothetical protein